MPIIVIIYDGMRLWDDKFRIASSVILSVISVIVFSSQKNISTPTVCSNKVSTENVSPKQPSWQRFVFDLDESHFPSLDRRISLGTRGIAAMSLLRPEAVLATYEMPHNQDGAELNNLIIALEALNGTVIPSGSEISFNKLVGPRLESRGYKAGLMYSAGRVIQGLGGGVCVASTALYNAALYAGLPIIERWMHSGPVSYADPARDSAVVYGTKDLKVKNNTLYPIWISATVSDGLARVTLMSYRKPAYSVKLIQEGPGIIPPPLRLEQASGSQSMVINPGQSGCDAALYREFWQGHKMIKREMISHDIRKPRERVIGYPMAATSSDNTPVELMPVEPDVKDEANQENPVVLELELKPMAVPDLEKTKPAGQPAHP